MKWAIGLILAGAAFSQESKECASVEECRAQLAAANHRIQKIVEQVKSCSNDLYNARLVAAWTLPDDLQRKLDSFQKPKAAEPAATPMAAKPDKGK